MGLFIFAIIRGPNFFLKKNTYSNICKNSYTIVTANIEYLTCGNYRVQCFTQIFFSFKSQWGRYNYHPYNKCWERWNHPPKGDTVNEGCDTATDPGIWTVQFYLLQLSNICAFFPHFIGFFKELLGVRGWKKSPFRHTCGVPAPRQPQICTLPPSSAPHLLGQEQQHG